jgi:hypothetical protein
MPRTRTSVFMQARGRLGPLLKTQVKLTSARTEQARQPSRLLHTRSVRLARRHAGIRAVKSDLFSLASRARSWGSSVSCCLQILLPAVQAVHEGCSASVASTAIEKTETLGFLASIILPSAHFAFVLCAFSVLQCGRSGRTMARIAPSERNCAMDGPRSDYHVHSG